MLTQRELFPIVILVLTYELQVRHVLKETFTGLLEVLGYELVRFFSEVRLCCVYISSECFCFIP